MPSPSRLVTNTSPLLTLLAACGSLELLHSLYDWQRKSLVCEGWSFDRAAR